MFNLQQIPKWRLYLYVAVTLLVTIYIGWSAWGERPQNSAQGFVAAKPAIPEAKVPGPTVQVKVVPKTAVKRKFPEAHISDKEEVIDTAKVPAAPNGATTITTIDTDTGEAHTEVKINEAPWLALERNNYLGAGYEIGTDGTKIPIYYKRDILRIKNVHLQAEVGGKVALDPRGKSEAHGTALMEYRW